MAYRIDQGPVQHWQAHLGPFPQEVKERLECPHEIKWAFNSAFERIVTRNGLGIDTPVEGWRCGMVLAYMRSFMGGLADIGAQMLIPEDQQKKKNGVKLIRRFCMPQKITTNQRHRRRNYETDPDDWQIFVDYNIADVVAEDAIRERLEGYPTLDDEWFLYALDQRINDRGMPFDRQFAINVRDMSERRRAELLAEMATLTGIDNPNSQVQLLEWLRTQGYPFFDIGAPTMKRALNLNDEGAIQLTPICVEVMHKREWAAKTATKKADTALRTASDDDRIRGMFQFCGASRTARWAGKGVQPQNMARTPKAFDPEHSSEKLDTATEMIRQGDYDAFEIMVDEPMGVFGGTMRGMFRASENHVLHICDYSSIEAVGLAWASRCERMLDVFRQKRDIYRDFGAGLYKKPYDQITSAERQICKPVVLGAGYGLGAGEVREDGSMTGLMAYAYNMNVALTLEEAVAAVRAYRETYAEVPTFWWACSNAAQSVLESAKEVEVGLFVFYQKRPFLLVRLPSGRTLYYYKPRMETREFKRKTRRWNMDTMQFEVVEETYLRDVMTYMGRNQHNTQWDRISGYGPSLVENLVQALCRDILKVGLMRLDELGFPIVGHSHDEIIVESRQGDNYYTWETMREVMTQPIPWLPDFPLGANGFSSVYYRK